MILVSSCLAGLEVRYNGTHSLHPKIVELVQKKEAIMICPELLGGLQTPREPAEIKDGDGDDVLDGKARVIEYSGCDVTDLYVKGAMETVKIAKELKAEFVVLKENSPSCGSSTIYNGEFKGRKLEGSGVTAALLKRNGIKILSEHDFAMILQS
ncbi:DUF523 domain-containing protein [Metabacillus sp. HB246100]